MATDLDGDSQMASSPESSHMHSEDSPVGSRTPTNNTRTSTSQFPGTSELSPPGSQTQSISTDIGGITGVGNTSTLGGSGETTSAQQQQQPGASWMNKRAEEEYQRAMDYVVDQDFSLDEFGDPFDERDMEEKLF